MSCPCPHPAATTGSSPDGPEGDACHVTADGSARGGHSAPQQRPTWAYLRPPTRSRETPCATLLLVAINKSAPENEMTRGGGVQPPDVALRASACSRERAWELAREWQRLSEKISPLPTSLRCSGARPCGSGCEGTTGCARAWAGAVTHPGGEQVGGRTGGKTGGRELPARKQVVSAAFPRSRLRRVWVPARMRFLM